MSLKIGLFYGSTTCYTEIAAERIQAAIGDDIVYLHNIKDVPLADMQAFDILILGISTWDFGELQEDWESHWSDINELDLNGKIVALFGMGDQQGYTDWFQDALGMLHDAIADKGCQRIGFWPNQGYEFAASKGLTEDGQQFVGLALDEDTQYDLSEARIEQWTTQVLEEIATVLSADSE
ncbi:flavodoxin FldB [Idiomarina xiamenensis]|uniref:Flavodoxin n=1 Tax=Idiomarina xiamenensis 10-D-4 TaxID=740709 RepID=K2L1W5_9GAMM|nr:flavodoxin FldB [Idiomarina xiamenensis]EKE83845.1 flavodoxin FldB [Idiomarina xiamenensis 10-D-4]